MYGMFSFAIFPWGTAWSVLEGSMGGHGPSWVGPEGPSWPCSPKGAPLDRNEPGPCAPPRKKRQEGRSWDNSNFLMSSPHDWPISTCWICFPTIAISIIKFSHNPLFNILKY